MGVEGASAPPPRQRVSALCNSSPLGVVKETGMVQPALLGGVECSPITDLVGHTCVYAGPAPGDGICSDSPLASNKPCDLRELQIFEAG